VSLGEVAFHRLPPQTPHHRRLLEKLQSARRDSVAYAVWTGSGAALVALIGVFAFHEPLNVARAVGFSLVVSGLVVLLGFERAATRSPDLKSPGASHAAKSR